MEMVRSGFVAFVGRPNAGKSTLVNALVGSKVAITSQTPQTTRHRLRAVIDRDDAQMVVVDTPGLHKPHDALGEELNRSALHALSDVDAVCFCIDATKPVGKGDAWVTAHLVRSQAPVVLVLTKADIATEEVVERQLAAAHGLMQFATEIVVSAVSGLNVEALVDTLEPLLPEGPRYFPRDMRTDQPLEMMIAEFIREKVLRSTFDEVPHAVGVGLEDFEIDDRADLARITAVVYVERESQKGIIIGKGGEMIKRVGTEAREDLERLLGTRVFLDLRVKVKKDWRKDAAQVRRFGYGEGL